MPGELRAGDIGPLKILYLPGSLRTFVMDKSPVSPGDDHGESLYLEQIVRLLEEKKGDLLARWRQDARKLAGAKHLDTPTLDDHIPAFIEELIKSLSVESTKRVAENHGTSSPSWHGMQRLEDGFDITEVVAEYNILRDVLQDLVESHGLTLHGAAFRISNWVLDSAIGIAVENYAKQQAVELQRRREEHLAFIAHDLRTPLNAISLAAQELEETLQASPGTEAGDIVDVLKRNLGRLNILVSRVNEEQVNLMSASGHKLVRRQIDLSPFVKSLIRDLGPLCESNATRITSAIPGNLVVYADALMLTQVFQNLITNAIRFTPGGEIIVGARQMGDHVECSVRDNGEGIPEDRIGRIFDKLETDPDPAKRGTGLGLAIVK
ncbi:MAG TPA: sensor histidine kinase, partial [Chthoniobacteraceae bacterium]|nr:sensor histidine kinase [Chthoniobacteraceae bacterium]